MSHKSLIKSLLIKLLMISNIYSRVDTRFAKDFFIIKIIIEIRILELMFLFAFFILVVLIIIASFIFIIIVSFFAAFVVVIIVIICKD